MSGMTRQTMIVNSLDLVGGSTWNSTSLDFIASIDSWDAASTVINYTKNTLYFENNIVIGIGSGTSTFVTST